MVKLLSVFGVTGQQGGALVNYILENRALFAEFSLRGVTRDATNPVATALRARGVEIVEADFDIPSTLTKAVAGSHAVFAITNFWEKASATVEISQGKAIADAAVAAGARQIIWSSLPSVSEMTGGRITSMKHFDSKAEVEKYIRTLNIQSMFFMPGWFMQNYLRIMRPKLGDDGTYVLAQPFEPTSRLPLIDIQDTGKFIAPALLDPEYYHGKRFTCATAFYTIDEIADTWTRVTGKKVKLVQPESTDEYTGLTEKQKKEANSAGLLAEYGYYGLTGNDDLAWTLKQVKGKLRTWEEFVRDNEPWFL
ncbi:NmrA-like family-domain-containing protein [Xylaria scruposa]|nr:NmrA-like family-domain-containing protein [Xylaria scruposa]